MDMKTKLAGLMAQCLTDTWPDAQGLPTAEEIRGLLAVPPDPKMGDYALPVFRLAKALRMAPPKIATTVVEKWSHEDVARAEAVNGYVNFFLNRVNFAAETLESVLKAGENYGSSDMGNGKTICLDYSSINIAKRFHIGHLSTTMIGHSLRRIYDFLGYKTVGINHLGDWGTQFGKMICAYKLWGNEEEVEKGGVNELVRLYVKFHEEAEKDPALDDQGRAWFKKIEDGDEEALRIFNWFKALTLRDTERVYKLLGVTFDSYAGESFYNDKMDRVINELKEKNLLTISEGASIVDLSEDNMSPCIILRSDGATLYATRDLAAAIYRHDTYHFDKCLYVVAYQQDLHFRQIFRVLEKMGYEWAKDCVHVAFGMISYEGQALSTRKRLSGRSAGTGAEEGTRHHQRKVPESAEQGGHRASGWHRRGRLHRFEQQPNQGRRFLLGSRAEFRRRKRPVCAVHPHALLLCPAQGGRNVPARSGYERADGRRGTGAPAPAGALPGCH